MAHQYIHCAMIESHEPINETCGNDDQRVRRFPNNTFNFGDEIGLSPSENDALRLNSSTVIDPMPSEWAPPTRITRTLYQNNGLRQDETHLLQTSVSRDFWLKVLKIAPPKTWLNASKVLAHLALVRPMAKPSNSILWDRSRKWLDEAIRLGNQYGWADDAPINLSFKEPEVWEAIRIVGDSKEGFESTTIPPSISENINFSNNDNPIPDARTQVHDTSGDLVDPSNDESMDHNNMQSSGALVDADLDTDQELVDVPDNTDIDDASRDGETKCNFVECNVKAQEALQALQHISRRQHSHIQPTDILLPQVIPVGAAGLWRITHTNLVNLANQQIAMRDAIIAETQDFIAQVMKDAVIDGPIEAHIRNIVRDSLHKAYDHMAKEFKEELTSREVSLAMEFEKRITKLEKEVNHTIAGLKKTTTRHQEEIDELIDHMENSKSNDIEPEETSMSTGLGRTATVSQRSQQPDRPHGAGYQPLW
ncbi:hypothetical protein GGS21DRAFT_492799 [Xylaria nigripes]|nr:hypothetical protein GGS21DRAFT_492799 [Xylaria nigripes]